MLTVPIYNYINCLFLAVGLSCGMRYPVTSNISPGISSNTPQITFDILNSEDDYIDTPTLVEKVKLAKNVEK